MNVNNNFQMKENNYYPLNDTSNKSMPLLNNNQHIMNQMNQMPYQMNNNMMNSQFRSTYNNEQMNN